jgi:hypothetical protein
MVCEMISNLCRIPCPSITPFLTLDSWKNPMGPDLVGIVEPSCRSWSLTCLSNTDGWKSAYSVPAPKLTVREAGDLCVQSTYSVHTRYLETDVDGIVRRYFIPCYTGPPSNTTWKKPLKLSETLRNGSLGRCRLEP